MCVDAKTMCMLSTRPIYILLCCRQGGSIESGARFTVENIDLLIENAVPPRQEISGMESSHSSVNESTSRQRSLVSRSPPSPRTSRNSTNAADRSSGADSASSRRAYFNRFEMRRRNANRSKVSAAAAAAALKNTRSRNANPMVNPSPSQANTSKPLIEFGSILRGFSPSQYQLRVPQIVSASSSSDALQRHGAFLHDLATCKAKQAELESISKKARTFVSQLPKAASPQSRSAAMSVVSHPQSTAPSPSPSGLSSVPLSSASSAAPSTEFPGNNRMHLRYAKRLLLDSTLLKAARAPFLFNKLRDMLFEAEIHRKDPNISKTQSVGSYVFMSISALCDHVCFSQ